MPRKKKFKKGDPILDFLDLDDAIRARKWIYLRDTPKHYSVIDSMTMNTVRKFILAGALHLAALNN